MRSHNKDISPILAANTDLTAVRNATSFTSSEDDIVSAGKAGLWRYVGKGLLNIARNDTIVRSYLGLAPPDKFQPGNAVNKKVPIKDFKDTMLRLCVHACSPISTRSPFQAVKNIVLNNSDRCSIGDWVMSRPSQSRDQGGARSVLPSVGKVTQILRSRDSSFIVVVQRGVQNDASVRYAMPSYSCSLEHVAHEHRVSIFVCLFTSDVFKFKSDV